MLNLAESIFHSIQGEGIYAGQPSIFVRLTGCNLRCVFGHTTCDTPYSSFNPEHAPYKDNEDICREVERISKNHPRTKHMVITGGEPLLQRKELEDFLARIFTFKKDWVITIETNGTLPPLNPLAKDYRISLYSISPKLSTSVAKDTTILTQEQIDHHDKTRLNYRSLFMIVSSGVQYQMKFVYSGPECVDEIKDIYSKMSKFVDMGDDAQLKWWMRNHPNNFTMLMDGIRDSQL